MPTKNPVIGTQRGVDAQGNALPLPIGSIAVAETSTLTAGDTWNSGLVAYDGRDKVLIAFASSLRVTYTVEWFLNGAKTDFMGNPTLYDPATTAPNFAFQQTIQGKGDSFRLLIENTSGQDIVNFFRQISTSPTGFQESQRIVGTPVGSTNLAGTTHAVLEGRESSGTGLYQQGTTSKVGSKVGMDVRLINEGALSVDTGLNLADIPSTDVSLLATESTLTNLLTTLAGVLKVDLQDTDYAKNGTIADGNTLLTAISQKLSAVPVTGEGLSAIFNKLPADPATQTTLNALLTSFNAEDFASQTTLAAVLAKLSSDPATQTTLAAVAASLSSIDGGIPASLGQKTGANSMPVVLASDQGAVPVTGTFFQATQPVSGPLTDTQLRASAVPVSGTFFQATQPVSAASLPLPSGAATALRQDTTNTALGTPTDAAVTDPTLSATMIALLKGLLTESISAGTTGTPQDITLVANVAQTIPANANRKGVIVSSSNGTILIGLGYTATATRWTYRIVTNGMWEIPEHWAGLAVSLLSTTASTATVTLVS